MRLPALKRLKLPRVGGWIGAGALAAASFWAGHSFDRWTSAAPQAAVQAHKAADKAADQAKPAKAAAPKSSKAKDTLQPGTVYVRRGGSVLRDAAKWSGHPLAHKDKGAGVILLEQSGDGWAKVKDGNVTGWMRASVLGDKP
ncbi:MAG: hypothetical protein H6924_00960 [Alphaproteobacteria bacterium]|nr:hypothetical protein [Alphaproteobacteria bacterium]